jgi:hypothetical protein
MSPGYAFQDCEHRIMRTSFLVGITTTLSKASYLMSNHGNDLYRAPFACREKR